MRPAAFLAQRGGTGDRSRGRRQAGQFEWRGATPSGGASLDEYPLRGFRVFPPLPGILRRFARPSDDSTTDAILRIDSGDTVPSGKSFRSRSAASGTNAPRRPPQCVAAPRPASRPNVTRFVSALPPDPARSVDAARHLAAREETRDGRLRIAVNRLRAAAEVMLDGPDADRRPFPCVIPSGATMRSSRSFFDRSTSPDRSSKCSVVASPEPQTD